MARKKNDKRKMRPRIIVPDFCVLCRENIDPDYKEPTKLKKFVTDRARILGTDRTGVCSKHQRKLTKQIKRARQLGLLPFAPSVK